MTVADDVTPKRPRFLTIEQVGEELAVGAPTVRQLLKTGELRGLQIGGRSYLAHSVGLRTSSQGFRAIRIR